MMNDYVRNSYRLKIPIDSPYVVRYGKALLITVEDKGYKTGDFVTLGAENGESVVKEIAEVIRNHPSWGLRDGYCQLQLGTSGLA